MSSFATRAWEGRFQKVAEGWVFRGPKRAGTNPRYLVNDAQKKAILASLPTTGQITAFSIMAICLGLVARGLYEPTLVAFYGHPLHGLWKNFSSLVADYLLFIPFLLGFMWLARERVRRVVADLPMTEPPADEKPILASFAQVMGPWSLDRMPIPLAMITSVFAFVVFLSLPAHLDTLSALTQETQFLALATLVFACCTGACLVSWSRHP